MADLLPSAYFFKGSWIQDSLHNQYLTVVRGRRMISQQCVMTFSLCADCIRHIYIHCDDIPRGLQGTWYWYSMTSGQSGRVCLWLVNYPTVQRYLSCFITIIQPLPTVYSCVEKFKTLSISYLTSCGTDTNILTSSQCNGLYLQVLIQPLAMISSIPQYP